MEKKQISFNEAFVRLNLLDDLRGLTLPAKPLAEVLIMKAALRVPMAAWAQIVSESESGTGGNKDDETRKAALDEAALSDCGCADRRLSAETFTEIVAAALAAGEVKSFLNPEKTLPAHEWLETLAYHLTGA